MATAFRFSEHPEPKAPPVTIMQRSLSAPDDTNKTFFAAVIAAGGNVNRSVSVEYGKPLSNAGSPQASNVAQPIPINRKNQSMSNGLATTPHDVDTSLNEDLFYPSVSAAAAVTLSPSYGPSSSTESTNSDLFYSGYLSQGSATWGMSQQRKQEEMPALGLPKSAESSSQSSQSPRSTEYHLRLSGSSNASAGEGAEMYQLRAAMANMQMSNGSSIRSSSGANNANLMQPQQQHSQAQTSQQQQAAMYDPSHMLGFFTDSYGAVYPDQYPAQYNRYQSDVYGPNQTQGGRGGGAQMMDQRYQFAYANTSFPMTMNEYIPAAAQTQSRGGSGYTPRGVNPYANNGNQTKTNNPNGGRGGGKSSASSNLHQQQQLWVAQQQQGFVDDAYHNGGNGHSRSSHGNGSPRGSILEDVRAAMRASSASQRHRAVMGANVQTGNYARGQNGNGMYMQQPQMHPHASISGGHNHHNGSSGSAIPYTLADVRGHAIEFAQDQFGSRWLQQQLSSTTVSAEDKQALFLELLPAARELAGDTFGNYCVQILLNPQVGTPEQQLALCQTAFEGNMLSLSRNTYACRCIQSLVKLFQLGDGVIPIALQDKMLKELERDIISLVTDSNANHVAQQIIERVRPVERITFVLNAFKGRYVMLAKDPYGCRVCQRVLEYATPEYVEAALEELLRDIDDLVTDSMGNYVVQHIITASGDRYGPQRARLVEAIKKKLLMFATHKFASNVVEKVLEYGDTQTRRDIIQLMLEGQAPVVPGAPNVPMLQVMMSDLFANYVCQRSLAVAERDQLIRLVAIVRANAHDLRRMTYGKHILSACEKAAAAAGIP